jgi:Peptidase C13 family
MGRFLTELRLTFRRVVRLGTFRRVAKGAAGVRPLTLIALFGLWLAMIALTDFLWAGTMLAFNEWGITSALAGWAVFAVSIVLLGGEVPRLPLARAMADSAGIGIVYGLLLATIGIGGLVLAHWLGFERLLLMDAWYALVYPAFMWLIVVFWRAGHQLWNQQLRFQGMRFLAAALLPIFLIPNQPIVFGSTTDWSRDDVWYLARSAFVNSDIETVSEDTASQEPEIDFEATIYHQPKLVGDALRSILPTPESRPQMYFVGLAPYSMQDVFKKEVLGAQAMFDERFGTRGRSIALINHRDTAATIALANATNLGVVLNGIGKAMNPKKDVLVLFITTHGSKELLSVSFPGFSLNQVTPEKLAQAFKESGIKNRILIISACYSGSFIPLLKNDDTLIMTAASADKTSFGCSNEREWTYFGDALFNHALRNTRSLPDAFEEARELIKEWETKEGITPSEPQISMGTSISRVLDDLVIETGERRADATPGLEQE